MQTESRDACLLASPAEVQLINAKIMQINQFAYNKLLN